MKIKCYCGHTDYCDCGPLPVPKKEQKQLLTEIMEADAKDGLYMQQTAVDWLLQKVNGFSWGEFRIDIPKEVIAEAKQIEKEQMIEFAQEVFRNRYNQITQSLGNIADDIYNETYNKNK